MDRKWIVIMIVFTAGTCINSIRMPLFSFLLFSWRDHFSCACACACARAQTLSTLDTLIGAPPPRHLTPTPGQLGFARQTPLQWNDHARQIQGGAAAAAETLRYGSPARVVYSHTQCPVSFLQ